MKEITLKGSINVKKNPDIIKSIVDNKTFDSNRLHITIKNNQIFIYHSYEKHNYNGRYYLTDKSLNTTINLNKNVLNIELKKIYWENWDSGKEKLKNVKIKIFFTDLALKKLNKFFH